MLKVDHYPTVDYTLPEASDTEFNLVKTIFLGKVFGKHYFQLFVVFTCEFKCVLTCKLR